jgi:hypothetical protein
MDLKTNWAAAAPETSDAVEEIPFIVANPCREILWPLIGIRYVPDYVARYLSDEAWRGLDELARLLLGSQVHHEIVTGDKVFAAAALVGRDWPMPRGVGANERRWFGGLDVPALWGVQSMTTWAPRWRVTPGADVDRSRAANTVRNTGSRLVDVMRAAIGVPPYSVSHTVPSQRALDRAWRDWETALTHLGRPFFLIPLLVPRADI